MGLFTSNNYILTTSLNQSEIYAVLTEKTAALSEAVWRFSRKKLYIGKVKDGEIDIVYKGFLRAIAFVGEFSDGKLVIKESVNRKARYTLLFGLILGFTWLGFEIFLYTNNNKTHFNLLLFFSIAFIVDFLMLTIDKGKAIKQFAALLKAEIVSKEKCKKK